MLITDACWFCWRQRGDVVPAVAAELPGKRNVCPEHLERWLWAWRLCEGSSVRPHVAELRGEDDN